MYSSYPYSSSSADMGVGIVFAILLAILAAAICIYIFFLSKKNEGRFSGFLGWLYDFLSFRKLMIEALLKIMYLFLCLSCIIVGIILLFQNVILGLVVIILGNVLLRYLYELALLKIIMCKNTTEINQKLSRLSPDGGRKTEPKTWTPPIKDTKCPNCGKEITRGSKFCTYCGYGIK